MGLNCTTTSVGDEYEYFLEPQIAVAEWNTFFFNETSFSNNFSYQIATYFSVKQ